MTPEQFPRVAVLPTYVFNALHEMRDARLKQGLPVFDFGMGNPDLSARAEVVAALKSELDEPGAHRYSVSAGIEPLRQGFCEFYQRRFGVGLDVSQEVVVTLGVKEGLAHLLQAMLSPGDAVLVPSPYYPIHYYGVILAGGKPVLLPLPETGADFETALFAEIEALGEKHRPKALILSFPHNPTTATVGKGFFERVVAWAKTHQVWVIHDFAYGDLCFDGGSVPSFLETQGACDVGVEFFSLSKSYHMAGWRVGFAAGNRDIIGALKRLKSYLDYGMFTPVQKAACIALKTPNEWVKEQCAIYERRRNLLIEGLQAMGWPVIKPAASMFLWAPLPAAFRHLSSMEFAKRLLSEAGWVVAPGIGFGEAGDGYVRLAFVQPEEKIREALAALKPLFNKKGS